MHLLEIVERQHRIEYRLGKHVHRRTDGQLEEGLRKGNVDQAAVLQDLQQSMITSYINFRSDYKDQIQLNQTMY